MTTRARRIPMDRNVLEAFRSEHRSLTMEEGEPDVGLFMRALIRIGLVRIDKKVDLNGGHVRTTRRVRWPVSVWPWWTWRAMFWPATGKSEPIVALLRNRPGVIKWEPGRLLPRRWGIRFLGFEFGDRG